MTFFSGFVMGRLSGRGLAGPIWKFRQAGPGRAKTFENVMGRAEPGRDF